MGSTSGTFTTPGTSSFVLPYGATITQADCWAGGGRGASMTSGMGGGAGGGAFSGLNTGYDNLWNATIRIIVGAGGDDLSVNGGNSSVAFKRTGEALYTTVSEAEGGYGNADNVTTGASGGSVITGSGYGGGTGAAGGSTTSGGGGGGAGNREVGGNATDGTAGTGGTDYGGTGGSGTSGDADGISGTSYGGGGGGAACPKSGNRKGGVGASGAVMLAVSWPDNIQMMIITDHGETSYESEMILNAGGSGQTLWVDSNSDGLANDWTGDGVSSYSIISSMQSIECSGQAGYIRSNDVGVTNALEHTYNIVVSFDTTGCANPVYVRVWALGSTEDLIMTLDQNLVDTNSAMSFQITSGDDFNGIAFIVEAEDILKLASVSCVQAS